MARTRLGQKGIGVRPYAGFAPKSSGAGPKSSAKVTRLLSIAIGGRNRRIVGKGIGPFTRLTSMAINGRRVVFEAKLPIIPPVEIVVTRLLPFGIGGKRVGFEPKTPAVSDVTFGGARQSVRTRKRKLSYEELLRMDAFGKAQLGILEPTHATLVSGATLVSDEINVSPILSDNSILQIDDDILLILAIMEAHNS